MKIRLNYDILEKSLIVVIKEEFIRDEQHCINNQDEHLKVESDH